MLPVYIEMPPTQGLVQVECERALLDACSDAAQPEHCERARTPESRFDVVAVVTWRGEFSIRVQVDERQPSRGVERRLSFSEEDPFVERCRAAGYVTGTLLEALTQDAPKVDTTPLPSLIPEQSLAAGAPGTEQDGTEQDELERATERDDAASVPAHPSFYVDGGCLVGSGPSGAIRYGPGFALGARLPSGLLLRAEGDVTFSTVSLEGQRLVPTRFWSLGAAVGAAWSVPGGAWLELSGGPFIENIAVTVNPGGAHDARFVGGMRGSLTLRRHLVDRVSALIAAAGGARFGDTTVRVDGEDAAHVPGPFGGGLVALSVDLR